MTMAMKSCAGVVGLITLSSLMPSATATLLRATATMETTADAQLSKVESAGIILDAAIKNWGETDSAEDLNEKCANRFTPAAWTHIRELLRTKHNEFVDADAMSLALKELNCEQQVKTRGKCIKNTECIDGIKPVDGNIAVGDIMCVIQLGYIGRCAPKPAPTAWTEEALQAAFETVRLSWEGTVDMCNERDPVKSVAQHQETLRNLQTLYPFVTPAQAEPLWAAVECPGVVRDGNWCKTTGVNKHGEAVNECKAGSTCVAAHCVHDWTVPLFREHLQGKDSSTICNSQRWLGETEWDAELKTRERGSLSWAHIREELTNFDCTGTVTKDHKSLVAAECVAGTTYGERAVGNVGICA